MYIDIFIYGKAVRMAAASKSGKQVGATAAIQPTPVISIMIIPSKKLSVNL